MKKIFIGFLIGSVLTSLLFIYFINQKKEITETYTQIKDPELRDSFIFTGDLISEFEGNEVIEVSAPYFLEREEGKLVSPQHPISTIKIYSQKEELITRLDNERAVSLPHRDSSGTVKLDIERRGIKLIDVTGFHHINVTIFSVLERNNSYVIEPICTSIPNKCYFYNTRGDLFVKDVDSDGIVEVGEIHDEYPPEGGRGRSVLKAAYKYDGKNNLFLELKGKDYEKVYQSAKNDYNGLIRVAESTGKFYDSFEDYWKGTPEY